MQGEGGGDNQRKKKKLSNRGFERLGAAQIKVQSCSRKSGFHDVLSAKLAHDVSLHPHLKQHKAQGSKRTQPGVGPNDTEDAASGAGSAPVHSRNRALVGSKAECGRVIGESGGQSDTATSADSGGQEGWTGNRKVLGEPLRVQGSTLQQPRPRILRARRKEAREDEETTPAESDSSDPEEEEEEGSYESDEGLCIKAQPSRDVSSSATVTGPSPSSVVKLEANQKARNKKERQELYGNQSLPGAEGDVKVKKRAPCRLGIVPAAKKHPKDQRRSEGVRWAHGVRPQETRWGNQGTRGNLYRRSMGLVTFPSTSERLKRATRKSTALRGAKNKRRNCWSGSIQSPQGSEITGRGKRIRNKQPKGRAVSRLLESMAADEGFQMDEDDSFSEGDEEDNPSYTSNPRSPLAFPSCILTKELLTDGLKVLISKEDELLYAARVRTLELPDIYSIVIEGERGNRPRIYSLEQLLQEAVLDVAPETVSMLTEGTRVCAYWSERSRCLYPGNVRRVGSGEERKQGGGVMVEFDDGDRGRISLPNIRLLPPGYQIHCAESAPAQMALGGQATRRTPSLEKAPLSGRPSERQAKTETIRRRPGRPKGSGKKKKSLTDSPNKSTTPLLSWPAVAVPRKRASDNLFQFNGTPRKAQRGLREDHLFPLPPAPVSSLAKGLFSSSSFEVDSFSSIANGFSSFCSAQPTGMSLGCRSGPYNQRRKPDEAGGVPSRGSRKTAQEFPVKLDHEGVTSPKTKNGKALLLLGGGSGFGAKTVGSLPRTEAYTHPVLLVKDNRRGGSASRAELLLKGAPPPQRKASPALDMGGVNYHRDCQSSYSDLDEDEDDDQERRVMALGSPAPGGLRTAGRFLSRLSVSSSSSGSTSSSSSGSLSSSSLCSSDNDSSYSSEDEEGSTLLLQSCLSSHHGLLQPLEPPAATGPQQGKNSFVAKAVAVSNTKLGGGGATSDHSANSKHLKGKQCSTLSPIKHPRDLGKRQRIITDDTGPRPKVNTFLPGKQLWRWSGNATQRRGLKGKAKKLFYKAIVRGRDTVSVGDCAVFLSAGRPQLPYVGRIENFWESWSSSMVVKVKWFYHPEETKLGKRPRDGKHALYQSCHEDENDVQTISHKCQVVSREEYERVARSQRPGSSLTTQDHYYLAGTYDPTSGQLLTSEGVSIAC